MNHIDISYKVICSLRTFTTYFLIAISSRSQPLRKRKMRKRMLGTAVSSLALAVTFGFAGSLPAQATPHVREDVCLGLDSGKIDTTGDPLSVTVTAPQGMVITGYCVKAGSINQGDGPVYYDSLNLTTLVISYPTGKAVSHYSVSYGPAPIVPPVKTVINEQPLAPTFDDQCGYNDDTYDVPDYNPALPYHYVVTESEDGLHVRVQVLPSLGHEFGSTVTTEWNFDFVKNECAPQVTFIVDQPKAPTVCDVCGVTSDTVSLPEDTDKYYYAIQGDRVFAVEKAGYIFQQDMITEWPIVFTDVPCEVVVPPVVEEPPAVTIAPVETIIPPIAVHVTHPVLTPPAKVIVPANIESVQETEPVVQTASAGVLAETGADMSLLFWAGGLLFVGLMAVLSVSDRLRRLVIKK